RRLRPASLTKAPSRRRIDIGPDIPGARGSAAEGASMTESVGRSAWHGIEVRHLAALQALAEEASFHGAARRLGYSQPAVSQQLAALERIVGAQLVNRPRVSQPLTLTEAGERLLVHARSIQASLATAEAELGDGTGTVQLRVGAFQSVAAHLLPHVMRELGRKAPHVEIVLDDCPGDARLVAALDRGDLDACFVDLPLRLARCALVRAGAAAAHRRRGVDARSDRLTVPADICRRDAAHRRQDLARPSRGGSVRSGGRSVIAPSNPAIRKRDVRARRGGL